MLDDAGAAVVTIISFQTFCEGGHTTLARRLWEIESEGVIWAVVSRCFVFSFYLLSFLKGFFFFFFGGF